MQSTYNNSSQVVGAFMQHALKAAKYTEGFVFASVCMHVYKSV